MQATDRRQEFLSFLQQIDENAPKSLTVHLVIYNYYTHRYAKVKNWLASQQRFHMHYALTYAFWLNQVERWFALTSQQAIRRGSFRSTKELVKRIERVCLKLQ